MAPVTLEVKSHIPAAAHSDQTRVKRGKIQNADDVDEVYDRLIHEAPYISSDAVEFPAINPSDMSWIDPGLVSAGQDFVSRNFFSLICAHLGALLYGFSFKSLSTLLLRTGNSSNVDVSLIRYLSTFMHLKTWYESNITQHGADGYQDVQRVKKMHLLALKQYRKAPLEVNDLRVMETEIENPTTRAIMDAVRKDLGRIHTPEVPHHLITYFPVVAMSQFDMVMTQFGVISLVYLFPRVLGIRNGRGLEGFLHLWAIIGKLLGIHDRFNLALYPSDTLYRKIFTNIGIGSLKDSDLIVIHLQEVLIEGVAKYAHFTTHKSLLYFGLSRNDALVNYEGNELRRLLGWKDYLYYWLMRLLLGSVHASSPVRMTVNFIARRALAHGSHKYLRSSRQLKVNDMSNLILKFKKRCKEVGLLSLPVTFNTCLLLATTLLLLLTVI